MNYISLMQLLSILLKICLFLYIILCLTLYMGVKQNLILFTEVSVMNCKYLMAKISNRLIALQQQRLTINARLITLQVGPLVHFTCLIQPIFLQACVPTR